MLKMEYPDILISVSNLALIFLYQGKYEAAEKMNRRALEGKEKMLGMEYSDTDQRQQSGVGASKTGKV
jgi:hypothetical protein